MPNSDKNNFVVMQPSERQSYRFLALTIILSLPFYLLNIFLNLKLPFGLPPSVLMIAVPLILAGWYIWQNKGWKGVKAWLASIFDTQKINNKKWLLFAILFIPFISVIAYYIGLFVGGVVKGPIPVTLTDVILIAAIFWTGAIFEELGWTTFATKPLQRRHGIFVTGLIIGAVWALWHVIPFLQMGRAPEWVAWQCLITIGNRVIMGYTFSRTNATTSPSLFYHAAINYMPEFLPGKYDSYNLPVYAALVWLTVTAFVIFSKQKKKF